MSRRAKITYPHKSVGNSTPTEKYHVGSIVFIPFVIESDEGEDWSVAAVHELQNYDGGWLGFTIPKEILP